LEGVESSKATVSDILLNYQGLNRNRYRPQTVETDLREMQTYLPRTHSASRLI
jgi:hypothetical protein